MSLILSIDTATEFASVCLADDENILALEENFEQKNHAAFLQPAIQKIFSLTKIEIKNINAVAVTIGPGSYTGLRVGLASAKGLSYALNKNLIVVNTLQAMALASIEENKNEKILHCPMIDARRMEVFTALYNFYLKEIIAPAACIIDENFLQDELNKNKIIFSGSGSKKLKDIMSNANAIFTNKIYNATHVSQLAFNLFKQQLFADVAYCQPLYLKEFYTPIKK